MIHELKLEKPFFDAVAAWEKNFEVRFNDRGFQKGDTLRLRAWNRAKGCYDEPYTALERKVTYVLSGYGLQDGFVVLALDEVKE